MGKLFAALIATVGWFALALQFVLMMTNPDSQTIPLAERIIRYFSFFTILTNLIVALTSTAIAIPHLSKLGRFATKPSIQAAVAAYISIVGIVYSLFLRSVWNPQGWQAVADHALHDVVPILYVVYWFAFAPKHDIDWISPVKWLAYPVIYIGYSLMRGAFVAWYPYWFVDVTQLGYSSALTNTALVLIAFILIGLIYAALAKALSRTANSART